MTRLRLQRIVAAAFLLGLLIFVGGIVVEFTISTYWGSALIGLGALSIIAAKATARRRGLRAP